MIRAPQLERRRRQDDACLTRCWSVARQVRCRAASSSMPSIMITVTADTHTYVDLIWIEKRLQRWIRFGSVASEQIIDRHRGIVAFAPGGVFAFVRWASNDFGTVVSRIDILRAVRPGEPCSTVGFVRPGGESLLRTYGWP